MSPTPHLHLFPSFHLDSVLRSLHLSTVTAKPWAPPTITVTISQPLARLRAAVAQLDLPTATATVNSRYTQSRADVARAAANIEAWLTYLPRSCVRTMVLDGWHWTT